MAIVRKSFDLYKVQHTASKRDLALASISCFNGTEWVGLLEFHISVRGLACILT